MKTFKKVVRKIAIFMVVLSMLITSQVATTSAGPVDFNQPVYNFNKILFVKKEYIRTTDHGSGGHFCDSNFGFNAVPGGGLFILNNPFSGTKSVTDVLANSYCTNGRYQGQKLTGGAFQGPDLSYDGNQIVFAYTDAVKTMGKSWDKNTTWHVFKVNVDGTNLTQLTDGPYNDFDPCWLPSGKIAFISERRGGFGRCHGRQVPDYNLAQMNNDGTQIRVISWHETNEFNPAVDNNGMIVWTRWDYVHRGDTQVHSPWITFPDGLDARPIMQNYVIDNTMPKMLVALRPIPNSNKYVAIGAPHHGQHYGPIVIIDPDVEDDDSFSTITKIAGGGYPESGGIDGNTDSFYATPWALDESNFLTVYDPLANSHGVNKHYSMYAVDKNGNSSQLYDDPAFSCLDPIPLRARTVPNDIIASSYTPVASDGIMSLMNVYNTLIPFPGGTTITNLRILQLYVKTQPWADYAGAPKVAYTERKNTVGVLGTVPVQSDGSAQFYLPPGKPVYFQALTSDEREVQTMRSDTFFINGQTRMTCDGCHEPRHFAPTVPTTVPLALRSAPSTITTDTTQGARPMSYPRLIQPILDSKCISCHTGGSRIDLRRGSPVSGNWFTSYNSLSSYVYRFPDVIWDYPRSKPGLHGSRASSLYTYLTNATHNSLTTAAEKHAFIIWMDSGTAPFYGEYNNIAAQEAGQQVEPLMD